MLNPFVLRARAVRRNDCVGEVINAGTGVETSINKLANVLAELFNVHDIKFVYAEPRAADIRKSCADLSKAERMLGYKPKTSLIKGLTILLRKLGFKSYEKCEG